MSALQKKLEEQKKIIEFLASKYEKDTGRRIELPSTIGQLLGDSSISEEAVKPKETVASAFSFAEAVEQMRFPRQSGEAGGKAGKGAGQDKKNKKELRLNPEHLTLERIDLSGFRDRRFSRTGLRELVDGIQALPCLRALVLRDNGINEDCEAEVLDLFSLVNLKCIDLSKNNIGPRLGAQIGKKMKDEVTHVQWIDLTQNEFYSDNNANSMVIQGLKKQAKLIYVGLTISGTSHANLIDQYVKLLMPRRPALNLNMRNSTLSKQAGDYLFKALSMPEYYLTSLSLRFCFLNFEQLIALSNALRFNKTLVKLDLGKNALKPCTARFVLDALLDNYCLSEVSFAGNFLDDEFAVDLAGVLEDNPVLYKVDIAGNPVGPAGAQALLNALLMKNETLGSLGDLN